MLSGVQRVCLDELSRLDSSVFEKFLICKGPGKLSEEAERVGVKCIYIAELRRDINPFWDLMALCKLYTIIKKYKFDIIHTHSSKPGVLGRIAARLNKVNFIVHTVHGFSFPAAKNKCQYFIYWIMEKIGGACGDILICLHDDDAKIAENILKIKKHKILVIKNGIDTTKFCKKDSVDTLELRKLYGIEQDKDVSIGMIGRLWPQKNPMLLLRAAKEICSKYNNVKFFFVGDGELRNSMLQFIASHKLERHINLCGWCNDVNGYLNLFDVFVLPSLWEGMPLAILEAESCSLPCIVSDIQGNRDLVKHETDGFLFSLEQSGELEFYLEKLINDKALRLRMGTNAREKILAKYRIEDRIRVLEKIYISAYNNSF